MLPSTSPNVSHSSPLIAGSVLPIKRAEELLATLPGVIAARIIAGDTGAVDEIHVLTSADVLPKQTVRNIESALIAHLGMRVDHRKISVATTAEPSVAREAQGQRAAAEAPAPAPEPRGHRHLYFQDVEVRRSRVKGIAIRVTLTKGEQSLVGEAEGAESERSRVELAARAALAAVQQSEPEERMLALDGARQIEAFDRQFVFVTVTARLSRSALLLTGSCEIKDSAETATVLAVLDATNRWLSAAR